MHQKITYDLLIHPFFTLAVAPVTHEQELDIISEDSFQLSRMWAKHISLLKNDPTRGLIILSPNFKSRIGRMDILSRSIASGLISLKENSHLNSRGMYVRKAALFKAMADFDSMVQLARKFLGDRVIVVSGKKNAFQKKLSLLKLGQSKGKKLGLSMGEYYDSCVNSYSRIFTELTGQRVRRSKERSFAGSSISFGATDKATVSWPKISSGRVKNVLGRKPRR